MGIIKVITHADAGEDYLVNCYNYVTDDHNKYCGAVNVRSDDALNQFNLKARRISLWISRTRKVT